MHSVPTGPSTSHDEPSQALKAVMEADRVLGPDIALSSGVRPLSTSAANVLLTGATGFLGAYLLRDLLRHTNTVVTCLVRGSSVSDARGRIQANLQRYQLTLTPSEWSRVHAVSADLSLPRFGLQHGAFDRLSHEIDTVVHSAAVVNFYQSYHELRATNVGGTREILRLVVNGRLKALHYVSTTGVFDSDAARGEVVREGDAPAHCEGSVMGYTQTKWVAEQLVLAARERGIPTNVYRTPFIMGDSETGAVDPDNLVVKMLLGCLQGGYWPADPTPLEMVPVNALSRAMVHLSSHEEFRGRTFHLASPQPMQVADVGLAARAYGYSLALPPYAEWKRHLREFARRKNNAMRPLLPLYLKIPRGHTAPVPEVFRRAPRPIFDSTSTLAALAPVGLMPPRMTEALIARYIDFCISAGWLQTPSELAAETTRASTPSGGSRPPQVLLGTTA